MFLNTQGRVLFDTFIIKKTPSDYLIECDQVVQDKLVKHLKMYKVRRKINISVIQNQSLGALFDTENVLEDVNCDDIDFYYKDSRAKELGFRIVGSSNNFMNNLDEYTEYRYKLGICEGSNEIPLGKCTPLEYNVEYMHGVSFQKGCYIGQELTARTHHTGVIRKRIMPIRFSSELKGNFEFTAA